MREAGTVVPELAWPTTAFTPASTSFCATAVPCFGSAASSSLCILKTTLRPPMVVPRAFKSSIARATPFSIALPRWAISPDSGPATPIVTTSCAMAAPLHRPTSNKGTIRVIAAPDRE